MTAPRIARLMARLAAADDRDRREAGRGLLAEGDAAANALIAALADGPPEIRKPAAFLLGRLERSPRVRDALARALSDEEPKVRKNAAIALGTAGDETSVPALAGALARETIPWVRPSIALALGAIGGDAAAAALRIVEPASTDEAEALRKARERTAGERTAVSWRNGDTIAAPVYAKTPPGLEDVAAREAADAGHDVAVESRGLLRFERAHPRALMPALRCIHDVRLAIAGGPSLLATPAADVADSVARILETSSAVAFAQALDTGAEPLRYRLTFEGLDVPRAIVRRALDGVRRALDGKGFENSPSHYAVRLAIEETASASRVWLVPTFEEDDRFAYRVRDVGASIDPVVAAGLARLVRAHADGVALDPCCGSGTLLVERARLDPGVRLRGIDISPTAVAAARANVAAAGLTDRVEILRGDAADRGSWMACDEAFANLPFGIRTKRQDTDLPRLYRALAAHLAEALRPDGRAVLYTANVELMSAALAPLGKRLSIVERRDVEAGGLTVAVWSIGSTARD